VAVESLPYTLILLLAQFTAGVAACVLFVQLRGLYEPAFIRICAWLAASSAFLLTLTLYFLESQDEVDGYRLDAGATDLLLLVSGAWLLFSLAYIYFLRREDEPFLSRATGATAVGLGAAALVLAAVMVRLPAWSLAGPLLTLFAGAATLGSLTVAMVWGHWYLVKPSLEAKPLNDLILIALAALVLQLGVTALNAIVPVGAPVDSDALLAVPLAENPGFWLRIGIGLVFPALLAYMAYRSSRERAMMSATGLLYIAVGAILAGEALARGLLFVTGAPV
jgi:hypothetical protein